MTDEMDDAIARMFREVAEARGKAEVAAAVERLSAHLARLPTPEIVDAVAENYAVSYIRNFAERILLLGQEGEPVPDLLVAAGPTCPPERLQRLLHFLQEEVGPLTDSLEDLAEALGAVDDGPPGGFN